MNNNDVLRRIRYAFDFNDNKMMKIFALADMEATRAEVSNWLKQEDAPDFKGIYDWQLATFLNGLINLNRGKRDGEQPKAEKKINNNIVFRKLRIALNLKDVDILEILKLADVKISKHELSAFFRKPGQPQFKTCKDQFLRNFLHGLQIKYRKPEEKNAD